MIGELYGYLPNPQSIPISYTGVPGYVNWMEMCQMRSIPIVKPCGIGMGLSHIIPTLVPTGYQWISAKCLAIS